MARVFPFQLVSTSHPDQVISLPSSTSALMELLSLFLMGSHQLALTTTKLLNSKAVAPAAKASSMICMAQDTRLVL